MNAYEVLNVPTDATRDEIRAAYRALARRWHPDRFMQGPERDWANEKMAEINSAYRVCIGELKTTRHLPSEADALERVRQMIDDGNYLSARKALMGLSTRCAEWNYLFGTALLRLCEREKALIYLSVAAHQNPDSEKYLNALNEARSAGKSRRKLGLLFRRG